MKKCLIYSEERHLKNAGGPLGYNYNLKAGLTKIGAKGIYFLNSRKSKSENVSQKLKKDPKSLKYKLFYNKFFKSLLGGLKQIYQYLLVIFKVGDKQTNFNDYSVLHFHSTLDIYRNQKQLASYKGIIVLTTHSPIMPSYELKRDYKKWTRIVFFFVFFFGKRIDLYAFKRANYILSPCETAMDSYKKYSKEYESLVKGKFIYLLTGCISEENTSFDENYIRSHYGLNNNKFTISYLGRHNKVKGYDILKEYAVKLKDHACDIQFVIGGKIGPLFPPRLSNWKEYGFTTDALGIMRCSDIYVSCNRDTYFDLATIQALSVGTIVVSSRTGGNLFFEKNKIPGVYLYDNFEEFKAIILRIKSMDQTARSELRNRILLSFSELFTSEIFARHYEELVNSLIRGERDRVN